MESWQLPIYSPILEDIQGTSYLFTPKNHMEHGINWANEETLLYHLPTK